MFFSGWCPNPIEMYNSPNNGNNRNTGCLDENKGLYSCGNKAKWNKKQRKKIRS